jgi:hypothetical protein
MIEMFGGKEFCSVNLLHNLVSFIDDCLCNFAGIWCHSKVSVLAYGIKVLICIKTMYSFHKTSIIERLWIKYCWHSNDVAKNLSWRTTSWFKGDGEENEVKSGNSQLLLTKDWLNWLASPWVLQLKNLCEAKVFKIRQNCSKTSFLLTFKSSLQDSEVLLSVHFKKGCVKQNLNKKTYKLNQICPNSINDSQPLHPSATPPKSRSIKTSGDKSTPNLRLSLIANVIKIISRDVI